MFSIPLQTCLRISWTTTLLVLLVFESNDGLMSIYEKKLNHFKNNQSAGESEGDRENI